MLAREPTRRQVGLASLGVFAAVFAVLGGPLIEPLGEAARLAPLEPDVDLEADDDEDEDGDDEDGDDEDGDADGEEEHRGRGGGGRGGGAKGGGGINSGRGGDDDGGHGGGDGPNDGTATLPTTGPAASELRTSSIPISGAPPVCHDAGLSAGKKEEAPCSAAR